VKRYATTTAAVDFSALSGAAPYPPSDSSAWKLVSSAVILEERLPGGPQYRMFWFWELEVVQLRGCPYCNAVAIKHGKCLGCGKSRPTVS
jgi:hypothetical protein